ncbi:protein-tyrosine phosphatase family protein [Mycobacterium hubeiense]|uniref:protein-tyrosine phosphatase family protein n=1 Tax=Mycobacterium hubeiense TaxID=1867256 RepID=UPI0018ED5589|nr:serine/threonine protein phosphatase [Mycobacterium sp. QGD 101]
MPRRNARTRAQGGIPSWPHERLHHAWWAIPDQLLAGEYPGAKRRALTAAKIAVLLDAGITSIVDLTTTRDRLAPYTDTLHAVAAALARTVRYHAHPIPDMGVTPQTGYDAVLAHIRSEMDSGQVVYVHCWGGMGRTTTVVGALLIDQGLDYSTAIVRIAWMRAATRKAHIRCPKTRVQHDLLRIRSGLPPTPHTARDGVNPPLPLW